MLWLRVNIIAKNVFIYLFSIGERISLSINLSMRERSGIKFQVTSYLGSLPLSNNE